MARTWQRKPPFGSARRQPGGPTHSKCPIFATSFLLRVVSSDNLFSMPGPTLEQQLEHALVALAEAEREYAAGVEYKGPTTWTEKIARIKQHIADLREMIANE